MTEIIIASIIELLEGLGHRTKKYTEGGDGFEILLSDNTVIVFIPKEDSLFLLFQDRIGGTGNLIAHTVIILGDPKAIDLMLTFVNHAIDNHETLVADRRRSFREFRELYNKSDFD